VNESASVIVGRLAAVVEGYQIAYRQQWASEQSWYEQRYSPDYRDLPLPAQTHIRQELNAARLRRQMAETGLSAVVMCHAVAAAVNGESVLALLDAAQTAAAEQPIEC
jgi:hypothetical protein